MNLVQINKKYNLILFNKKNNSNINHLFSKGIGVFLVNLPTKNWFELHNIIPKKNYSEKKKLKYFNLMNPGSFVVSPTEIEDLKMKTISFHENNIFHIGHIKSKRISQILMSINIIKLLIKKKDTFDYCLVYNFYPCEIIVAFFLKLFLKKRIIVDFEDDYSKINKSISYNLYFKFVKHIPDITICINEKMTSYFKKNNYVVHNGFFNLDYYSEINTNIRDNCKFLFSGTLDEIRGVDLVPDLIFTLRNKIKDFKIIITGSGKLENLVQSWNYEELIYLGYLEEKEYELLIQQVDICLVLQKPDNPFNEGSFPSKIEYYAKYLKPIYILEMIN